MAAGFQPVDLNNVFITSPDPGKYVNIAERDGFPLNCCTWIKGIYGICMSGDYDTILCVTTGDCSNSIMLMEVLKLKRSNVISFAYPLEPDRRLIGHTLENLAERLRTTLPAAEKIKSALKIPRNMALELDRLTWQEGLVSGYENHFWLVSTSDFNRNTSEFRDQIGALLNECSRRKPYPDDMLRLAYIGVPPVFGKEFYSFLEKNNARVVFNEVQRQFAMPVSGKSLAEQYSNYTYPYSIYGRLKDIKAQLKKRKVDGVIHYVQAFCHRGIGDIIFRESLDNPILTLEGNQDFYLTQHAKTRIEAFLDMLRKKSKVKNQTLRTTN